MVAPSQIPHCKLLVSASKTFFGLFDLYITSLMLSNSCIPHLFLYLDVLQIEAVTRRILWVKANDHRAKVLVFSSWNDVLDVLEHAFAANNITFFRMKGGRYDNLRSYFFSIYLCIYTGLLDIHLEKEKKKILTRQRKNYDYDPIVLQHI